MSNKSIWNPPPIINEEVLYSIKSHNTLNVIIDNVYERFFDKITEKHLRNIFILTGEIGLGIIHKELEVYDAPQDHIKYSFKFDYKGYKFMTTHNPQLDFKTGIMSNYTNSLSPVTSSWMYVYVSGIPVITLKPNI